MHFFKKSNFFHETTDRSFTQFTILQQIITLYFGMICLEH